MIARLLRLLWCAAFLAAAAGAMASIASFGDRIGAWSAGLLGVMVVAALHPLAVAANFAASRLAGDPVPSEFRLSPWRALRMFDAEVDASVRGVWFANPFLARRRVAAGTGSRSVSILFVHGYLCNRAVWLPFLRDAAARGYRCEAVTLTDPFAAIDAHVAIVDAAIAALALAGRPVAIVAHSMGGLVVRAALQRLDPCRVAHVVTLGSPHRGTWTARFGRSGAVRDMRLDSPRLRQLARSEEAGEGLPRGALTSIYSVHDDIVFPQSTARLAGAENVAIGGCGHVALLYDRRVRDLVFERLAAFDAAQTAGIAS